MTKITKISLVFNLIFILLLVFAKTIVGQEIKVKEIQPWKQFTIDAKYGGYWYTAGDLDGDGIPEVIGVRNRYVSNKGPADSAYKGQPGYYASHYTTALVVHKLDGSVMWRWGDPTDLGEATCSYDVACQIYDWDGDGQNDVYICTKDSFVELDGRTGKGKRHFPLPTDKDGVLSTDCITFANISGNKRATDVLIKTRYTQVWAYNSDWKELWTQYWPGGFRTAHQARPFDVDNDGRDEVMVGFSMINPNGDTRFVFDPTKVKSKKEGHLDCIREVYKGKTPEECRYIFTGCLYTFIAYIDGNGKVLWEKHDSLAHFESINVGQIIPNEKGFQFAVDLDHGANSLWVIDEKGNVRLKINDVYARSHNLIDWDGDGFDEIVLSNSHTIYNYLGQPYFKLMGIPDKTGSVFCGDFSGDGIPDIFIKNGLDVTIYKNEKGSKPKKPANIGFGTNFSVY